MRNFFNLLAISLVAWVTLVAADESPIGIEEHDPQAELSDDIKAATRGGDDRLTADMSDEDKAILKLINLSSLSEFEINHRKSKLEERCSSLEKELRNMLQKHPLGTKDRHGLLEGVAGVLVQKKLPFGNSMPSLKVIQECLPEESRDLKKLVQKVKDKVEEKMDKVEEKMEKVEKKMEKVEDKLEKKLEKVVDEHEDKKDQQVPPHQNHQENHHEQHTESQYHGEDGNSRNMKHHTESIVEHHTKINNHPAPVVEPTVNEHQAKDAEIIRDLTKRLEKEKELNSQKEQIIAGDAKKIEQLNERLALLMDTIQKQQQKQQEQQNNQRNMRPSRDARYDMMKRQYEQAVAREAELQDKLEAARGRLNVLARVAKDDMDEDDYKKVITDLTEIVSRMNKRMRKRNDDQRTVCQKYYTLFTYPGKVRKGVIKVIAKMRPEAIVPYYGREYYEVLKASAEYIGEYGGKSTAGIARELMGCLSLKGPASEVRAQVSTTLAASGQQPKQIQVRRPVTQHSRHSRHKARQQRYFAKRQQSQSVNGQVTSSGYVARSTNGGPMQVQPWPYPTAASPFGPTVPMANVAGPAVGYTPKTMGMMPPIPAMPPMPAMPPIPSPFGAHPTSMYGTGK